MMGVFTAATLRILLVFIVFALVFVFGRLVVKQGEGMPVFKYFMGINAYLLAVLILIVVGVYV